MSTAPSFVPDPKLVEKAKKIFKVLASAFTNNKVNNYWQVGNAAETLIDSFRVIGSVDLSFICKKHQWFVQQKNGKGIDGLWFDDYLWWVIAAIKGGTLNFPAPTGDWRQVFDLCWQKTQPALTVWQDAVNKYHKFQQYQPRFDGGVWNASWGPQGPWHELNGDPNELRGIQNAVVNTLYLKAAASSAYFDPSYSAAAMHEFGFLENWFNASLGRDCMLHRFTGAKGEACALVHERVRTFRDPTVTDPNYLEDFYWAGDQGLLIGGMISLMGLPSVPPDIKQRCLTLAGQIIHGVSNKMIKDQKLENWIGSKVPQNDDGDYNSGSGVFMRYALQALSVPALKAQLQQVGFDKLTESMANNVPEPPSPPIVNEQLNHLTNNLATLLTAITWQK